MMQNFTDQQTSQQKTDLILLFGLLGLAAFCRIYGLDRLGLWADELWVVMDSTTGSWWEMLQTVYYHDNHPPGLYIILRISQWLFGSSDIAIRFLFALTGIVMVPGVYIVGRKHYSKNAALIAAALVATSWPMILYSQDARPNIMLAFFAMMSLHFFRAMYLEGHFDRKVVIAFTVCAAASAYLHYAGLVFVLCLGLVYLAFLSQQRTKTFFLRGVYGFLPFLILYAPWLPGTWQDLTDFRDESWHKTPNLETINLTFHILFGPGETMVWAAKLTLLATLLWLGYQCSRAMRHQDWPKDKVILIGVTLAMIVLPVMVFYIKSILSQAVYNHRHFLFAVPLTGLLMGFLLSLCIDRVKEKARVYVVTGLVIFISLWQLKINDEAGLYTNQHYKQEYREGVAVLASEKHKANITLFDYAVVGNSRFFNHYLKRNGFNDMDFLFMNPDAFKSLDKMLQAASTDHFYFLESVKRPKVNDMVSPRLEVLASHYQLLCRTRFSRVQAMLFSFREVPKQGVTEMNEIADVPVCEENLPELTQ